MAASATPLQVTLLLILIRIVYISSSASTATAASTTPAPSLPPSSVSQLDFSTTFSPPVLSSIFSTLGFQELSTATATSNLSTATPLTIFAPSDSSLLNCPSCSLPLLLKEHSIPGLYPISFLRKLAFGTKVETMSPSYCLTITTTTSSTSGGDDSSRIVFVNGMEVTRPDIFNNGVLMIHGLQGFVTHLSPLSCNVETMTSLRFPQPSPYRSTSGTAGSIVPPSFPVMRLMLKDAIIRLRLGGYSIVSLAMTLKFAELSELKAITVFTLDDHSIFSTEGYSYTSHFRFHVVPNRRIMAAELVSLPPATLLPTLEKGQNLVVTTPGGGGPMSPMKINYVRITTLDLLHNSRIVFHAISAPFPHMHYGMAEDNAMRQIQLPSCNPGLNGVDGVCEVEASVPSGFASLDDMDDYHGL